MAGGFFPSSKNRKQLQFQRNGTVQVLHCPGTKGQRDKLKILPWDGTGWDTLRREAGVDNYYFSVKITVISYFTTSLPVLEHPFLFYNMLFLF